MSTFLIIVIVFVFLMVILLISAQKEQKSNQLVLESKGYRLDNSIKTGKYLAGHPDINEPVNKTDILPIDDFLDIFNSTTLTQVKIASIRKTFITNVVIEDQTTIEKRVTVARLLLVGIFAFALRKKQVNELAYMIIEWNDGKFNHETIFEFEGKDAMMNANTSRNHLIKELR
ncbi:MAG: hypothetical protein Q8R90_08020 [Bacteroidales bacterium]|nr:hypothetical protein [Bacteroidales bacterium]